MGNIDQIELGTAATIQVVTDLPTTNVENFQQGTLFKLPSGQVFRLTKPIFKATPLITDFELLVTSGKTPLSSSDIIEVNGDMDFDTTGLVENTELLVICLADSELTLQNTRVINRRALDNLSTASFGGGTTHNTVLNLVAGEVFYFIYKSPTESYYEKLRDPNLAEAALKYWAEYWVSNAKGLSTNHGKSIEAPYQTVLDFTSGWIDFGSRVNIMSGYDHAGGWTLADQNYITFEGAGKTSMMYGGIEITGVCEHITFRNLHIAGDVTWGGQRAIKFTDSGGSHLLEGMSVVGNTAATYLEFGTLCFNATADGLTTFGKKACTIRDSDLTGSTGNILLPDLGASEFAYIKLENTQISSISIGTGWYVLHDADSKIGNITYTGTATSAQLILTSNVKNPKSMGGVITSGLSGLTEVVPTSENQVLKPVVLFGGGDIIGLQWVNFTEYPSISGQASGSTGTNLSAMLHSWIVSDGNYQSFEVVVDIWESGTGSGLFSRFVKLAGALRMDIIQGAGTVNINEFIIADQVQNNKGTLELVYNGAGYGGAVVELKYTCNVPFTSLNINKRVLQHTIGS